MRAVAVTVRWLMPLLLVVGVLCDVPGLAAPVPYDTARSVAAASPAAPHATLAVTASVAYNSADSPCADTPAAAETDDLACASPAHVTGWVPIATGSSATAGGADPPPRPSCTPPYGLVQAGLTVLRL